jgi:hypothetical protein
MQIRKNSPASVSLLSSVAANRFCISGPARKSTVVHARRPPTLKEKKYAETYDSRGDGDGSGVDRKLDASSCGDHPRATSNAAADNLQLDLPC